MRVISPISDERLPTAFAIHSTVKQGLPDLDPDRGGQSTGQDHHHLTLA